VRESSRSRSVTSLPVGAGIGCGAVIGVGVIDWWPDVSVGLRNRETFEVIIIR
jgi:hypothetical protein